MLRVFPAHDSFESRQFLRRQIDNGLVEDFDLTLLERFAQIAFDLDVAVSIAAHARIEDLNAI
jgi:hypothetical protein